MNSSPVLLNYYEQLTSTIELLWTAHQYYWTIMNSSPVLLNYY